MGTGRDGKNRCAVWKWGVWRVFWGRVFGVLEIMSLVVFDVFYIFCFIMFCRLYSTKRPCFKGFIQYSLAVS